MSAPPMIYGLLAEFESIESLVAAVRAVRRDGYTRLDAYTPAPVEELAEELGLHRSRLPWVVFAGGLVGCVGGFLMQHYCAAISYPLNIGGRPLFSWPMWIPITFEMTVLIGAITAILAMLGMNGLPQPYHPLFNVERFACASKDRVFLCIEARDPKFDLEATKRLLAGLHPREVWEVPR
jgi:Protein of unknown function (DUF3341)